MKTASYHNLLLLLPFSVLFSAAGLMAQPCYIDQPTGQREITLDSARTLGQTFRACGDGVISEIRVTFKDTVGEVLRFELGNFSIFWSPDYDQDVNFGAAGDASILLHEPFPVQGGRRYALGLTPPVAPDNPVSLIATDRDVYSGGGTLFHLDNTTSTFSTDLKFSVSIVPNACTQVQPASTQDILVTERGIGQTMTACATGALTHLAVDVGGVIGGDLRLEIVDFENLSTPLYSQSLTKLKLGESTIRLTTPFLVQESVQYGIIIRSFLPDSGSTVLRADSTNRYDNGSLIEIIGGEVVRSENSDLKFTATIVDPVCRIDQPKLDTFFTGTVGQQFTACDNGRISHIRFSNTQEDLTEIRLDLNRGANTIGADFSQVSKVFGTGDQLIPLEQGFNVLQGETYSFSISTADNTILATRANTGNSYTNGSAFTITDSTVTYHEADLDFSILIFKDDDVVSLSGTSSVNTHLHDAYPNPATNNFTVSYSLGQSQEVIIELYNLTGQRLQRVVKGRQPAGDYLEPLNVTNLPPGVYLYCIRTDTGYNATKKMVVH